MIYQTTLVLHSLLRWAILILLIVNIVKHFNAGNRPFTNADKKAGLWLMIAAHTTLLIGLYQWIFGPLGLQLIQSNGMAIVMNDAALRFWTVEHTTGMLIAIVLITLGKGVMKKALPDTTKHKRSAILYTIALIIIIASIPWPFREAIARPLLPGI